MITITSTGLYRIKEKMYNCQACVPVYFCFNEILLDKIYWYAVASYRNIMFFFCTKQRPHLGSIKKGENRGAYFLGNNTGVG